MTQASAQQARGILPERCSKAVAPRIAGLRRSIGICQRGMFKAFDVLAGAVRFARSVQRVSGLIDDASLTRKGDPGKWLELAFAGRERAQEHARARQRLMDERRLKSEDFAAKDIAMARAGGEIDFPA